MKQDARPTRAMAWGERAGSDSAFVLDLFTRAIALGTFYHGCKLLRRLHAQGLSLLDYSDFYAWTPGLYPPAAVNLVVNWIGFAAAAAAVVVRPGPWTLSAWALLSVSHFFVIPLRVPNHYLLLVVASVILAVSSVARRLASMPPTREQSLAAVLLRHLAIITYAFAFLHKLNWSYLDTSASPIERLFEPVAAALGWGGASGALTAAIPVLTAASLATEAALPILLVSNRLRRAAFVLGGCFHALTALGGALDYSMIMLTFYVLFLPPEGRAWADRFLRPTRRGFVVQACTALLLFRSSYLFEESGRWRSSTFLPESVLVLALLLLVVRGMAVALFEWPARLERRPSTSSIHGKISRAIMALAMVALFDIAYIVNCMGPYLGLKYEWSQAMFSGLSVTGNNHLFIPQIYPAEPYLYEVQVKPRTELAPELVARRAGLQRIAGRRARVEKNLLFSLLLHLCQEPHLRPIEVSFRRGDARETLADACAQPRAAHPFNLYPW